MRIRSAFFLALGLLPACAHARSADTPADTCIFSRDIDHTTIVDDQTILFAMRHHVVYRNRLATVCSGLKAETMGFTYEPTDPGTQELCSRAVTIRLNTVHNSCLLGDFVKVK